MTGTQLIITLSLYIISIAVALLLSIVAKKNAGSNFKLLIVIHVILFSFFIITSISHSFSSIKGYLFLFFFCSGVIIGGYLIRTEAPLLIRIYFALYIASIVVFILSPSFLVRAISLSLDKIDNVEHFHLKGNYFLEEEQLMMKVADTLVLYKITQHFGVFHKTMARNIHFGSRLDSIKLLSFHPDSEALIRGYLSEKSTIFDGVDSLELHVALNLHSNEIIQKKKY